MCRESLKSSRNYLGGRGSAFLTCTSPSPCCRDEQWSLSVGKRWRGGWQAGAGCVFAALSTFSAKGSLLLGVGGEIWFSWQGRRVLPVFCGIGMALDPGCVSASPTYPRSRSLLQPVDVWEERVCYPDVGQKPTWLGLGLGNPRQH